jgi:phosphomannomutase / phosphoglucomutase
MTTGHILPANSGGAETGSARAAARVSGLGTDPWKPCDLRGVFPEAVSPQLFRDIGGAIGTMLPLNSRVVVAGDFRLSTPQLKRALSRGLLEAGANVLDAGQGPTPVAYFVARLIEADAALIVTASHNPAEHNGLKLMFGRAPVTPEQLAHIRSIAERQKFRRGRGLLRKVTPSSTYMRTEIERWKHLKHNEQRRVVLDAGNGAWSVIAPLVFRRLGFEIICISCEADGRFPDRSPDCSRSANLVALRNAVTEWHNSVGIAWDGDGDRVAFIDESGKFVSPDEIALLLSAAMLQRQLEAAEPNTRIVVDVKCSTIVSRAIQLYGGIPLLERTGHAFMRSRMLADHALLGLDACGHYFFHELDGGDDGLFAALFVLDLIEASRSSLVNMRGALPQIFCTPDLRIPAPFVSFADAAEALTAAFPGAAIDHLDGLRLSMGDGTVLVRESGTEPVISLRIEGFDRPSYERILALCLIALPSASEFLRQELQEVPTNFI